jgi:hypothetical protein
MAYYEPSLLGAAGTAVITPPLPVACHLLDQALDPVLEELGG